MPWPQTSGPGRLFTAGLALSAVASILKALVETSNSTENTAILAGFEDFLQYLQ
jgi:hypothetical protein